MLSSMKGEFTYSKGGRVSSCRNNKPIYSEPQLAALFVGILGRLNHYGNKPRRKLSFRLGERPGFGRTEKTF